MDKRRKKIKIATIGRAILIIIPAYLFFMGILICLLPLTGKAAKNPIIQKNIKYIPYPAVSIGSDFISINRLAFELVSVKYFYENQDFSKLGMRIDFSTAEGEKRLKIKEKNILNKLIDDSIIEAEAKKRNINITSDIIDQEVDRKLKEYGSDDFLKENLQKLYGWNMEDFKANIVKPDLYRERLAISIRKNDLPFVASRNKIASAQDDLAGGMSFLDAVKKYSEGESAKNNGELGWFTINQMIPEVSLAVLNQNKGYQSGIIESSIGYHIVRIEDKKNENGEDMLKLSQIFVRTQPFSEWLLEKKKDYRIINFIREFQWNEQAQEVDFRDIGMENYEKDLMKSETNDPSMMF
jgi:foldase protein PrsA